MGRRRRRPTTETATGTRPAVRLARATPWAAERRLARRVGVVVTGLSLLLGGLTAWRWPAVPTADRWAMGLLVAVFGLAGLACLFAAVHQALAARVAETVVEVDRRRAAPGETIRVRLRQPGPVALRSWTARLVCKTVVDPTPEQAMRNEHATPTARYAFHPRFLDVRDVSAPAGRSLERAVDVRIPPDATPTGAYGREHVHWLIEVWGRVRLRPGFMHQYELIVVAPARPGRG